MLDPHDRYLVLYLQDHHTAATGGIGLARRAARGFAGCDPEARGFLDGFADELVEDRDRLLEALRLLGAGPHRAKDLAASVGERVGRLKPNGHVLRRSPYSDLVELELLTIAVQGKRAGWIALRELADPRLTSIDLDDLIARAERQSQGLEDLRRPRAARILRGEDPTAGRPAARR